MVGHRGEVKAGWRGRPADGQAECERPQDCQHRRCRWAGCGRQCTTVCCTCAGCARPVQGTGKVGGLTTHILCAALLQRTRSSIPGNAEALTIEIRKTICLCCVLCLPLLLLAPSSHPSLPRCEEEGEHVFACTAVLSLCMITLIIICFQSKDWVWVPGVIKYTAATDHSFVWCDDWMCHVCLQLP
jgi:hypothetical protein